ncbi:unnamed protein product, partial [Staurois parvus]
HPSSDIPPRPTSIPGLLIPALPQYPKYSQFTLPQHPDYLHLLFIISRLYPITLFPNTLMTPVPCLLSLSANPSTGLHSCPPSPLWPPLASTQCPPPLSANPSTGLHSVSSIPLC